MVGANHGHTGKLALRTRGRGQGHGFHAGDILEHLLQFVHAGKESLPHGYRRQRMARQETRQHRQRVTGTRVVFHGAGAQRIELGIDGKILL